MDIIESMYRKNPSNPITLRRYIGDLVDQGHVIESHYLLQRLLQIDPLGFETNRLAYKVSVFMMSPDVSIYDKNLHDGGGNHEQIYSLHLLYYSTFNDIKRMKDCAHSLLDIELKEQFSYEILLDCIRRLEDVELTAKCAKYLSDKVNLTEQYSKWMKGVLLKRLIFVIRERQLWAAIMC